MAKVPVIEEQLSDDMIVLNFEKVALSDDDFIELCADNRDFILETTAQKELLIMALPGAKTGRRNTILATDLEIWARHDGRGITFSPFTPFHLPNGARRAPDASWLTKQSWNALTEEQQEKLPPLCPDFVAELMSPSDRRPYRFRMLQAKMDEYISNGAKLGWLIDPYQKRVYVYRPDEPVQTLEDPHEVSGEPLLRGFLFNAAQLWQ
jgi:Uma2 family endonuclease